MENLDSTSTLKRTPLYNDHVKLKGRIVPFAGWEMPVQYSHGLAFEHEACRKKTGLFDVSHMGELRVRGSRSIEFLNSIVTNNVEKIKDNQAQYNILCFPNGGCVDDLIVHRFSHDDFFLCVNAANTDKDFSWILSHAPKDVSVENVSSQYAQIAIQGRFAQEILQKLTPTNLASIQYYWFLQGQVLGEPAIIARTGYTGEDGFEVYLNWDKASYLWNTLLECGQQFGVEPCGLGARDTLRTEMKYALYGHEIDDAHGPIEAGLGWVVKLDKCDFIGKTALQEVKQRKLHKKLVGLKSLSRAIPRQGYKAEHSGKEIGYVTSGTLSPSLKVGIAIAYLEKEFAEVGTTVDIVVRDQRTPHIVVETPFYKRDY